MKFFFLGTESEPGVNSEWVSKTVRLPEVAAELGNKGKFYGRSSFVSICESKLTKKIPIKMYM